MNKIHLPKLRKSCLTGKAIWIFQGFSKRAEYQAYHRACRCEVERVKHWDERMGKRKANIMRMLNDCVSVIPMTVELSSEQAEAVRCLQAVANEKVERDNDFYAHIQEVRRRRKTENKHYVK